MTSVPISSTTKSALPIAVSASAPSIEASKKVVSRGATFTPAEDVAVAKSWINVSENAITGTEQKGADFYQGITDLYNDKYKPPNREERSVQSIKARCKSIHKECMVFNGCHARLVRQNLTGVSATDLIRMATGVYNGIDMHKTSDDCGIPFKYLKAWEVLKSHEKFVNAYDNVLSGARGTGEGTTAKESDGSASCKEGGSPNSDVAICKEERPTGRKRAKEELKKKEARKKLKIAAESVAAQIQRNNTLKRHYEIMLFTSAPDGCDPAESVEHFKIMRSRALKDLRKETETTGEAEKDQETNNNDLRE